MRFFGEKPGFDVRAAMRDLVAAGSVDEGNPDVLDRQIDALQSRRGLAQAARLQRKERRLEQKLRAAEIRQDLAERSLDEASRAREAGPVENWRLA
jgi:hypothetical protein